MFVSFPIQSNVCHDRLQFSVSNVGREVVRLHIEFMHY